MRRGYARNSFERHSFRQQKGCKTSVHLLRNRFEACLLKQFPKSPCRGVMNFALNRCDTHIVDEPTPGRVAVTVDDHQMAARPEDTPHFGDCAILPGVMVEAVGARDDVKTSRSERETLTVSLNREDGTPVMLPARLSLRKHVGDEVDTENLGRGEGLPNSRRENARSTTNVENAERPFSNQLL
jgi:hypothetical protein